MGVGGCYVSVAFDMEVSRFLLSSLHILSLYIVILITKLSIKAQLVLLA